MSITASLTEWLCAQPRDGLPGPVRDLQAGQHAIVTGETRSGASHTEDVWYTPMNAQELDQKFDRLVEPRFGRDKTMRLRTLLKALPTATSVRPLAVALQAE